MKTLRPGYCNKIIGKKIRANNLVKIKETLGLQAFLACNYLGFERPNDNA